MTRGRVRAARLAAVLVLAVGATACRNTDDVRVAGASMIVDPENGGPRLCSSGINAVLPPHCDGVPLRGVDVDEIEGARHAQGVTWVDVARVEGRYVDRVLHVDAVGPPEAPAPRTPPDFSPRCAPPPGGWPPYDEVADARTRTGEKIRRYEQTQPATYAGGWVERKIGVFTSLYTGDLDRHRQALERIVPGRVCVAGARLNARMLTHISNRLHRGPSADYLRRHDIDVTSASVNYLRNRVEISVVIGGEERQRRLDKRYGKYGRRVVVITSSLLTRIEE